MKKFFLILLLAIGSMQAARSQVEASSPEHTATPKKLVGTYKTIRKVPVIIVSFSDWAFSNSKAKVDSMFNSDKWQSKYGGKSIREYFKSSSGGNYQPQFDIYGPVTLSHPYTYYYQISINWSAGTYTTTKNLAFYAAQEACNAINDTVDFSQYDGDDDGNIDLVYILYAGYGANDYNYLPETVQHPTSRSLTVTNLIWPHYAHMSQNLGPFDGKGLYDYECSNELDGVMEAYYPSYGTDVTTGIGVATHEFSHALGLPDMYQTSGFDKKKRMGQWDIMDQGCYNNLSQVPSSYSSWERWIMGWIEPIMLDTASNDTLPSLIKSNKAYYYTDGDDVTNPAANAEPFYMLENRQKEGFDWCLPGHGLLMTKITYKSNYSTWQGGNNTEPFAVDIVEADGLAPSYSSSDQNNGYLGKAGDCFPTGAKKYVFQDADSIASIVESNNVITFEYKGGYHPVEPEPEPEPEPTALEEVQEQPVESTEPSAKKYFRNGRIEIEKDGHIYDVQGHELNYSDEKGSYHIAPLRMLPAVVLRLQHTQTNGNTLIICRRSSGETTTEDGYQILLHNQNYYYARMNHGEAVRTNRLATDADHRCDNDQHWLNRKGQLIH